MIERFGFFSADSEHASLLACFDFDPNDFRTFEPMRLTVEKLVKEEYSGSYLIYADAKTMREDEDENEWNWDYYSIGADELKDEPAITLNPKDERAALALILRLCGAELTLEPLEEPTLDRLLLAYDELVLAEASLKEANSTIAKDELVYRSCGCGASAVVPEPVKFDPTQHDARQVLEAFEVGQPVKASELIIQELPPHLAKTHGAYWASPANGASATFMGHTQKALRQKAALHQAWTKKFGDH